MKLSKFYPLSLILAALFLFAPAQSTAQSGPSPRKAEVLNGIDVLKKDAFASLKGKKIGLLTNQTGRDKEGNSTIDLLFNAPGVELRALFAPEHGIRGACALTAPSAASALMGAAVAAAAAAPPPSSSRRETGKPLSSSMFDFPTSRPRPPD